MEHAHGMCGGRALLTRDEEAAAVVQGVDDGDEGQFTQPAATRQRCP